MSLMPLWKAIIYVYWCPKTQCQGGNGREVKLNQIFQKKIKNYASYVLIGIFFKCDTLDHLFMYCDYKLSNVAVFLY